MTHLSTDLDPLRRPKTCPPYLAGPEAIDVSRMTGIPWMWAKSDTCGPRHPFIDLNTLAVWEQYRVVAALIGGYNWLATEMDADETAQHYGLEYRDHLEHLAEYRRKAYQ